MKDRRPRGRGGKRKGWRTKSEGVFNGHLQGLGTSKKENIRPGCLGKGDLEVHNNAINIKHERP